MSKSIFRLIGNTPLVEARTLVENPKVKLYFKLEGQNPGGSVKDRAAYNMIKSALDRGEINENTKLIEATSGNTGIALAMIASMFKLDIELVMPENATKERVQTMRAYGAKVTLTSAKDGIEGSRDYAEAKVENEGYFMFNQFSNEDNWKAHYKTTGPEIWKDTNHKVTHFVSSMGTTGTIMGTSTYLKEQNKTRIAEKKPTAESSSEPEPTNGTSTVSPGLECSRIRCAHSGSGFIDGCAPCCRSLLREFSRAKSRKERGGRPRSSDA